MSDILVGVPPSGRTNDRWAERQDETPARKGPWRRPSYPVASPPSEDVPAFATPFADSAGVVKDGSRRLMPPMTRR
jgi:hypothetical protein